jgi:hypothetical protein
MLLQTSSQSEVCTQSYGPPNLQESQLWKLWDSHLDVALVERHKIYYKGEGGGFPQVRTVVNLVSPRLPMVRLSTKNVQIMH